MLAHAANGGLTTQPDGDARELPLETLAVEDATISFWLSLLSSKGPNATAS